MTKVVTFQDLKVWQKAHGLVLGVYRASKDFPAEEKYGLAAQLRRSAVSVPANIAEGFKRKSKKAFSHFLNIADASLEETKYHLILSADLGYLPCAAFERLREQCDEAGRMLCGLDRSLIRTYHL